MASFHYSLRLFRQLNWANRITLLRIGALVPILVLLCFPNPITCWIATIFFVAAALSDVLDGYIARKEGQVTTFGKFLDPLADKLLICSVLIAMVGLGWVPAWVSIVVVVRELAVTGLRAVAADNGVVIAADTYGKWKTVLQSLALVPLLIHYPFWGINVEGLGIFILYIALLLTVVSGVNYFSRFYRDWAATRPDALLAEAAVAAPSQSAGVAPDRAPDSSSGRSSGSLSDSSSGRATGRETGVPPDMPGAGPDRATNAENNVIGNAPKYGADDQRDNEAGFGA